jgi:hypothetical protein
MAMNSSSKPVALFPVYGIITEGALSVARKDGMGHGGGVIAEP